MDIRFGKKNSEPWCYSVEGRIAVSNPLRTLLTGISKANIELFQKALMLIDSQSLCLNLPL
ncbi:MAG: hypothetical protein CM1200mP39_09730 [Dehalococcoidia bacterium]|nr:MAG: hypothetical protein CM1200mP39_09730 [Dehalococcoidia bacterium]